MESGCLMSDLNNSFQNKGKGERMLKEPEQHELLKDDNNEKVKRPKEWPDAPPQRISELVEGEKLFDSQGFSLVKTTKLTSIHT